MALLFIEVLFWLLFLLIRGLSKLVGCLNFDRCHLVFHLLNDIVSIQEIDRADSWSRMSSMTSLSIRSSVMRFTHIWLIKNAWRVVCMEYLLIICLVLNESHVTCLITRLVQTHSPIASINDSMCRYRLMSRSWLWILLVNLECKRIFNWLVSTEENWNIPVLSNYSVAATIVVLLNYLYPFPNRTFILSRVLLISDTITRIDGTTLCTTFYLWTVSFHNSRRTFIFCKKYKII